MSADDGSPGYDTGYDSSADPHGPDVGLDGERLDYRALPQRFRSAGTLPELVALVRAYGWLPPFAAVVLCGLAAGFFQFLSGPYTIANGYFFTGWPAALLINVFFGFFLTGFFWFLYFGVIGSLTGFFAEDTAIDKGIFQIGGYLLLLFVPALVVGGLLAVTIPPSVVTAGSQTPEARIAVQRALAATVQMQLAGFLLAVAWVVVGFLLIPLVAQLYGVSRKVSVGAVLPVTLLTVVVTLLVV
jgi:hypothetical protein